MSLFEAETLLPALHTELNRRNIKHNNFVRIHSGRNYVFSDMNHVVCKIEGERNRNSDAFTKEVRVARLLKPHTIATQPALDDVIQVNNFNVSVWVWHKGGSIVEKNVTQNQIMEVLLTLTRFHGLQETIESTPLASLYDVMQTKTELITNLHTHDSNVDTVKHLIVEHINNMNPVESTHLLHGDAHMGNFIFNSGTATLCDLENVCMGEPEYDFGALLYLCDRLGAQDDVLRTIKSYCERQNLDYNKVVSFARIKGVQGLIDNVLANDLYKLPARLKSFYGNRLTQP